MPAKVNVEWLKDKCPKPEDCGKCLEVCPSTVFWMHPISRVRYKQPERFVIVPSYPHLCVSCNKCIEACPKGAIKVEAKK